MDAERTRFSPRSSRRRRRWACALIVDAGKTEFHGVPTKTCCAVGPAWTDEVDAITGDLSLL